MEQNEFDTVDEAYIEVLNLRRKRDVLQKEMIETLGSKLGKSMKELLSIIITL